MTPELQRLLSDLDDVRHSIIELITAAEITFSRDGGSVIAECLPTVLCRELDRICDALLNHPA